MLRSLCKMSRNYSTIEPCSNYDAIIVGAGHNGLVAAAYLAKNNLNVCVLEKRSVIGGAAVTEEIFPGYKISRASYLLSLLRPQIYKDLELKKHGLKYYLRDPSSYTPLKKEKWNSNYKDLTLGPDPDLNRKEISKFSNNDAKQFSRYEKELQRFADSFEPLMDISPYELNMLFGTDTSVLQKIKLIQHSKDMRRVLNGILNLGKSLSFANEMMVKPATDVMDKWFETDPLKATLLTDACIGSNFSPSSIGSGYNLLHHVMGGIDGNKGAWAYPEGGMGSVSTAIANCAITHGAHIFTNQGVKSIEINNNETIGVVTEAGKLITSSIILSNATPKVTFFDLISKELLDPAYRRQIKNINYASATTKVNAILNELPNFEACPNQRRNEVMPHHRCTIHLNCESMNDILQAYEDGVQGILPKRPMIEMMIPSSVDPTLGPKGKHVCLLFVQYTPYELSSRKNWDEETKHQLSNIIFQSVEEYAAGFKNSIIDYEILTPPDLEQIFGLTGGNVFHGELSLSQLLFNRPANWKTLSPYTPITGLYLCGSGAHPGGGVTGSPGRLAALEVIKNFRNRKQ